MTRRLAPLGALVVVAALVAPAALLAFGRSGAGAAGPGRYGYGMMGGTGGHGPGVIGGYDGARSSNASTLVIRHQYAHCHTWSLNGGPFKAVQAVTLERGASLTVRDYDVMPHRLVELGGNDVTMRNGTAMPMMGGYVPPVPGLMSHMGAWTTVTFAKAGVYRFRTRAGEDFLPGIETSGADNVLALTVTVR